MILRQLLYAKKLLSKSGMLKKGKEIIPLIEVFQFLKTQHS